MRTSDEPKDLLVRLRGGDRGALARLLSLAESEPDRYEVVADAVTALAGRAFRVGITGPGGAGKSTLIDTIVRRLRDPRGFKNRRLPTRPPSVAILATDPTSERTGGALLGDRVRFTQDAPDPGVFFRSVATRGAAGGLPPTAFDQLDLLDAWSFDWILIEAAGAGQSEIEVAYAADVTLVVFAPGGGDAVQALKAGLMEVGDVFCINKADLPGAERAAATLRAALEASHSQQPRQEPLDPADVSPVPPVPPVVVLSALEGTGGGTGTGTTSIDELLALLVERTPRQDELERRRRARLERRVRHLALREFERRLRADAELERAIANGGAAAPHRVMRELLDRHLR